jgi:hypothetical protein
LRIARPSVIFFVPRDRRQVETISQKVKFSSTVGEYRGAPGEAMLNRMTLVLGEQIDPFFSSFLSPKINKQQTASFPFDNAQISQIRGFRGITQFVLLAIVKVPKGTKWNGYQEPVQMEIGDHTFVLSVHQARPGETPEHNQIINMMLFLGCRSSTVHLGYLDLCAIPEDIALNPGRLLNSKEPLWTSHIRSVSSVRTQNDS